MARFLIALGIVSLAAGLLWPYLSRIGLGRLPGDFVIERECDLLFPANDVFAFELAAELGLLGPESLNKLPPRPAGRLARQT
jgi:hypothetical protein